MSISAIILATIAVLSLLSAASFVYFRKHALAWPSVIIIWVIGVSLFFLLRPWGFVDNFSMGYKWDAQTGQTTLLNKTGYVSRTPFLQSIYSIDLRPQQVCITSGGTSGVNTRVLNCKLVSFNPEGFRLFLKFHGADNYSGAELRDLLKIYAYDSTGTNYPFITIENELKGTAREFAPPNAPTASVSAKIDDAATHPAEISK